jgi:SAM-dependent methyltransferase
MLAAGEALRLSPSLAASCFRFVPFISAAPSTLSYRRESNSCQPAPAAAVARQPAADSNYRVPDNFYARPANAEAYDSDMGRSADAMDDVPFYVELAREAAAKGEAVLELGCGTGRVTIPIAQAGVEVVGLDNAPAMLQVARRKAAIAGVNIRWLTADMRSFSLEQRFGLVIIPFRSFLHLLTDADQEACLSRIFEHLLPDGRLALNFFVQKLAARGRTPIISRIYKEIQVRYVSQSEMESLLARAGFQTEALYGWFDKRPFTDNSGEMVWLARKPPDSQVAASHNDRRLQ